MSYSEISDVALFVDADNLSGECVDWVINYFKTHSKNVPLRRAYGGIEKLAGMKEILRLHAVRAFLNQGKGTTDVTLVIDIMDLLHTQNLPRKIAIMSSDADFAPLAIRLREQGKHITCFAMFENSNDESLQRAYDEVVYIDIAQPSDIEVSTKFERKPTTKLAKFPKAENENTGQLKADASSAEEVKKILAAIPDWLPDTIKQLNQLGTSLRSNGVTKGSKPLHELFRKYPNFFKVLPSTGAAKQVRLLKKP